LEVEHSGAREFFLDPYKEKEREHVDSKYTKIRFSFEEIKPSKQTKPPNPKRKLTKTGRKSKRYLREVNMYILNDAKWKQAIKYCEERNWNWRIITEKEINIY